MNPSVRPSAVAGGARLLPGGSVRIESLDLNGFKSFIVAQETGVHYCRHGASCALAQFFGSLNVSLADETTHFFKEGAYIDLDFSIRNEPFDRYGYTNKKSKQKGVHEGTARYE